VLFALAIAAAVITGDRTGSFWLGLLAFLVAGGAGRAIRALLRRRPSRALARLVWPVAATGYAFLFDGVGLPRWATFFAAVAAASLTRGVLGVSRR